MAMRMMLTVISLSLLSQALMAQDCSASKESAPVAGATMSTPDFDASWQATFDSDIRIVLPVIGIMEAAQRTATIQPLILVSTAQGTFAIHPESACVAWSRHDLTVHTENHIADIVGSGLALIAQHDTVHMVSLGTGATLWSSSDLSWKKIAGYVPLWRSGVLLVTASDGASRSLVSALELRSGRTIWTRQLWENDFEDGKSSALRAYLQLLPPVYVSDSVVVIWATKDGPMALNILSGEVQWAVPTLKGRKVPLLALRHRQAQWIIRNGVLYIPYEKRLAAIDASTGDVRWDMKLQDPAGKLEIVENRILVQGWAGSKGSIDLRDVATGTSLWGGATTGLKQPSPFVRLGADQVYVATGGNLASISLEDGVKHKRGAFDFKANEVPVFTRNLDSLACFAAEQNIACIREDGSFVYRRYYAEPDKNLFRGIMTLYSAVSLASATYQTAAIGQAELMYGSSPQLDAMFDRVLDDLLLEQLIVQVGMSRMATRLGSTNYTRDRAVFLTKREDANGRNRWTLVDIDMHDGAEIDTQALDVKPRMVLVDPLVSQVIYLPSRRELVALLIPERD